jgi:Uma2 family endonuclease
MGAKTLLTVEEFLRLPDEPGKQELSYGELIVAPPADLVHSETCRRIQAAIFLHLMRTDKGVVYLEAGARLGPDTIRQPDVSVYFVRPRKRKRGEWAPAPDIAIEVLSPSNSAAYIDEKISQYLAAGSKSVWIVNPETRRVRIYRADGSHTAIEEPHNLTDEAVLPGFSLSLTELFAE